MFVNTGSRGSRRQLHILDFIRAGLVPTLPNDSTKFLNGLGAFAVPSSGGAWTKITDSSPSGTGTVTFSSIPNSYKHLVVLWGARGDQAATSTLINLTFNNDGGSNYFSERLNAGTAGTFVEQVGTTSGAIAAITAANGPANWASNGQIIIPNYANTTFNKTCFGMEGGAILAETSTNIRTLISTVYYKSTSAINRMDLVLASGNYVSGSYFELFGIS